MDLMKMMENLRDSLPESYCTVIAFQLFDLSFSLESFQNQLRLYWHQKLL